MTDIITLPYFTSLFGQAADDARLSALISAASGVVRSFCRRDFTSTTYSEYFTLRQPTNTLTLRQYPVTDVVSLKINPDQPSFTVVNPQNVAVEECGLIRFKGATYDVGFIDEPFWCFPAGRRTVLVEYVAGYADIPSDLQYATAAIANRLAKSAAVTGIYKSETIGDYSYTLRDDGLAAISDDVKTILNSYRSYAIGGD